MYKLTFDDKPEANTYIKWASQKGYKVEGPFREKLAKNAKKFDLNGKPKKYGYVVIRKRGGGPGMGGAMPSERKYYNKKAAGEDAAKYGGVITPGIDSKGREMWTVRSEEAQRELEAQTLEEKEKVTRIKVPARTRATKSAAQALRDSLDEILKKKPIVAEPVYAKRPVSDVKPEVARALTQDDIHPAPKKRGRPKKVADGAVAVAEKPPERPSFTSGRFAAPPELKRAAYKSSPEAISRAAGTRGIDLTPEQIKESQRKVKGVIEEKVKKIAPEPSQKPTAAEQVAAQWEARGETAQVDIMARAAERERKKKAEEAKEAEFWEREKKLGSEEVIGERVSGKAKRLEEEVKGEKYVKKAYWNPIEEAKKAKEKAKEKEYWEAMKASAAKDRAQRRKEEKERKTAKKEVARQESARKQVIRQYHKEGRQLPAGVTDYVAEKEKLQSEKAEAIGKKKAARIETAEQAKKYQETVRPEEGKWTYAEAQAKAKEMEQEEAPGKQIKIGKRVIQFGTEKRKAYILRGKKPGEYKVVAGTKKELETPTSIKAALAKEKRGFKKRKKLLEKPLREIKRAKKVLRTTSRHGARQLLRSSRSLDIRRGKHPAIGNVSMQYRTAKIATMPLVPRSVAGTYVVGEDTKRRRQQR